MGQLQADSLATYIGICESRGGRRTAVASTAHRDTRSTKSTIIHAAGSAGGFEAAVLPTRIHARTGEGGAGHGLRAALALALAPMMPCMRDDE